MRAYVITIEKHLPSWEMAQRCVATGQEFGTSVEVSWGCSPDDDPVGCFQAREWYAGGFDNNPYSRLEPCMSTFLSHEMLWFVCQRKGVPFLVLEHDAVFRAPLPDIPDDVDFCNFGRPSFGKFNTPPDGFGPLVSKRYMPGAHAYYVTPKGAEMLLAKAATEAEPTDVYLNIDRFPFLMEYHPWPIICDDSFSTIQKELGCRAKHNEVHPI